MTEQSTIDRWRGLSTKARARLETRDYAKHHLGLRLSSNGIAASEAIHSRGALGAEWIPGVELFARKVYQQRGRGYFSELARLNEGILQEIGLMPKQWASTLMHRDSAKGFHIHPPFIPDDEEPSEWFGKLYGISSSDYSLRPYDKEQWDVMFFLTGICEMILTDEREGMPARIMRFTIAGDSRPGPDNAAVVIPPGVGHALRNVGNEDLIMVYGTSTTFNPEWEGRIESAVENSPLPRDWEEYIQS